jgi:hypothetical protein
MSQPQRTLASLQQARGYVVLEGEASAPARVAIKPMQEARTWRRIPGAGRGKQALYEQEPTQ